MIDYTTPEAKAALEIAIIRSPVKGLGQGHIVDFILLSKNSLWYVQAKKWSEESPNHFANEFSKFIWQKACKIIVETVDQGFNVETGKFWDRQAKLSQDELLEEIVTLSDFGFMLEQYRQNSMDIISRGFETFIEIINGKDWKRKYKKFLKANQK